MHLVQEFLWHLFILSSSSKINWSALINEFVFISPTALLENPVHNNKEDYHYCWSFDQLYKDEIASLTISLLVCGLKGLLDFFLGLYLAFENPALFALLVSLLDLFLLRLLMFFCGWWTCTWLSNFLYFLLISLFVAFLISLLVVFSFSLLLHFG